MIMTDTVLPAEAEVLELQKRVEHLSREEVLQLQKRVEYLSKALDRLQGVPPGTEENYYPFTQFLARMVEVRGRAYRWLKDYIEASNTPGCRRVKLQDIHKWQREGRVPAFAVKQIPSLRFPPPVRAGCAPWSRHEIEHLAQLCRGNPKENNIVLARKCSEQFGRPINESSIKGQKHRLALCGLIPEYNFRK